MRHWGDYFKRGLPPKTQDIYWQEVQYFSDAAMNAAKDHVPRHFEIFPRLVHLLPLMQQMEERYGPRKRFEMPSEVERFTGFGEWSERDLVKEALGWKSLLGILPTVRFQDGDAINRTVEQGQRYKHDLEAGLRKMGIVGNESKDPIGDVVRKQERWDSKGNQPLDVEGFKKAAQPEAGEELPF